MKNKPLLAAIYGLFSENGECLYIGRTRDVKKRKLVHLRTKSFHRMSVIRWVPREDAPTIERELTGQMWAKGAAKLSKPVGGRRAVPVDINKRLKEIEDRRAMHAEGFSGLKLNVKNAANLSTVLAASER